MKRIEKFLKKVAVFFALGTCAFAAAAQDLSGYDIMKRSKNTDTGKTGTYTATMTLINKTGTQRVREVVYYTKDYGDTDKTVIVFRTPKDVAGVGYLMWEYDEKADGTKKDSDNWLYMPAMKKVRRISGSESGGDFMGTDFTYDDMGDRALSKDTFNLLGSENINNADCWKIECVAKDKTEKNPRRIVWIRKDNYKAVKGEYYDRQNVLQRKLECEKIEKIDGIWTIGKMTMQNVRTNHSTVIEMKDVHYNMPINDSVFTVASLERGAIK